MSDPLSDFSQPDADFDPQKTEPQNSDAASGDENDEKEVKPDGLTDDEADRAVRHD